VERRLIELAELLDAELQAALAAAVETGGGSREHDQD
jgi:hypothetical protein